MVEADAQALVAIDRLPEEATGNGRIDGAAGVADDDRDAIRRAGEAHRHFDAGLARATAALLEAGHRTSGVYHATASGATTWFGFATAIFEGRKRRVGDPFRVPKLEPITSAEYPTPAKRPKNSMLSNAKLENVFGVRLGDWREALDEALDALPG